MSSAHTLNELAARLAAADKVVALLRDRLDAAEKREQAYLAEIQSLKDRAEELRTAQDGSRDE